MVSGRIKQERYVIKLMNKKFQFPQVLIAASCWPSILWSLNLNSNNILFSIYMFNVSVEMVEEIKICFENVVMVESDQAHKMMQDKQCFTVSQGEVDQLWKLWMEVRIEFRNRILVCPFDRLKKRQFSNLQVKWIRFKHSKLGGLTDEVFLLGVPRYVWKADLKSSISNLNLSRTLFDIVDQGEVGKSVSPPAVSLYMSRFNWSKGSQPMCVPSYQSATGWVSRRLSFKEMALCLDLNEIIIDRLKGMKCELLKFKIETGAIIPGKICQIAVDWMFQLWSTTQDKSVHVVEELETPEIVEQKNAKDEAYLDFEQRYLESYGQKASKNDGEEVPVELWDRAVLRYKFDWLDYSQEVKNALKVIRNKIAFRWYLHRLRSSFSKYLQSEYGTQWWTLRTGKCILKAGTKRKRNQAVAQELQQDLKVGRDAITRATTSSWWEWKNGSSCFFWRWPKEIRKQVRDGFPVHIEGALPTYRQRQVFHLNKLEFEQLSKKIQKVINRGYLEQGYVRSLINYFAVPKGKGDIRVVYDGTKCGLNSVVWAPNFFLPSIDSLAMFTSNQTWFADLDLGEMFLNYFIDERVRPYCGVDVSKLSNDGIELLWGFEVLLTSL